MSLAFVGAQIFDGQARHAGAALVIDAGRVQAICDPAQVPKGAEICEVSGLLAPGCVDLQVNGGGGLMLNNAPVPETVATMAAAHARLGTTSILPTLITDTQEVTAQAIRAVHAAVEAQTPGVAGMHLEGPHLSVPRKGAHDAALIRPMTAEDCADLERAAQLMPSLMVTVAPENASNDQIARLAKAGAVVSLGHSDTDFDSAEAAAEAGARCVTHLFNAMSPMTSRSPGVVGAGLDCGGLCAGVIADGIHVHRATLDAALRAKRGPGRIFLVSDAMALAGSQAQSFSLGGRESRRGDGDGPGFSQRAPGSGDGAVWAGYRAGGWRP